jgi:hypothetical protein
MDDERSITFDNIDLMICGMAFVAEPPATVEMHPQQPVGLNDALAHALKVCGLEDRLEDVAGAMREFMRPHFESSIREMEELRRRVVSEDE